MSRYNKLEMKEGVLADAHNGLKLIIPTKNSRPVILKDLLKVFWDSLRIKIAMLRPFVGKYPLAMSISHCQIEEKDPLTFFVVDRLFGWHFGNRLFLYRLPAN